jgi:hypothetical protein
MMPLQPFMNQFGGGYYPARQGHGVYQNPSWPAISQNQSFPEPWSQMSQPTATSPVTTIHIGIISPTSINHVGDWSTTSTIHIEYQQPSVASHVKGTNLVILSHTAHTSPTYASHVGDSSSTYDIHVEGSSPTYARHVGNSSPTSTSNVGYFLLASASHAGSMSPATAIHARGIHMIEKPRRIRCKHMFLCRLFKGDHLTRMCPTTYVVQEAWSFPRGPLVYESSLVSQHYSPSLVDTAIMSMQSSAYTPLPFGGDASLDLVVSHPVQPVVMFMQYSTDTTHVFGGDASLDLVVSHPFQPTVEEVVVSMESLINPILLLESDKSKEVSLVNVLNLHRIDLTRKYYTHLQREIKKEEAR